MMNCFFFSWYTFISQWTEIFVMRRRGITFCLGGGVFVYLFNDKNPTELLLYYKFKWKFIIPEILLIASPSIMWQTILGCLDSLSLKIYYFLDSEFYFAKIFFSAKTQTSFYWYLIAMEDRFMPFPKFQLRIKSQTALFGVRNQFA